MFGVQCKGNNTSLLLFLPVRICNSSLIPELGNSTRDVFGTEYMQNVTYYCDLGYKFSDDMEVKTVMCQASGEWEPWPEDCISEFQYTSQCLGNLSIMSVIFLIIGGEHASYMYLCG